MKGKDALGLITIIGLLLVAFAILWVIATNRAQHVDSLSNILSSIVSGLLGALGGGAIVAHSIGRQTNTVGEQMNVNPNPDEKV